MVEQGKDTLDFSSLSHYIPMALTCIYDVFPEFLSVCLLNTSKWHGAVADEFSIGYRKTRSSLLEKYSDLDGKHNSSFLIARNSSRRLKEHS